MKRAALALLSGSLLAVAFPPFDAGAAAWFLFAPLILLGITAPSARAASASGLLFGLAFHGVTFAWWYELLVRYGRLSQPEASGVYLLLALYVAAYFALFSLVCRRIAARLGAPLALLLAPPIWAGLELIRGRLLTGLPWSLLGATQHDHPLLLQVADLGGVTVVSLVVAAGNAAVAWAWLRFRSSPRGAAHERAPSPGNLGVVALLAAPIALTAIYGAFRLERPPAAATIRVGLVQGNVPEEEKWEPSARLAILNAHLQATRRAAAKGARLVVWPESSVPLPLTSKPEYRAAIESVARELKIDLLIGSVHYDRRGEPGERTFNSAFLIRGAAPGSSDQRYDKRHLVPYGEYVPLHEWLGFVNKLVMEASDFSPGDRAVVMEGGGARLGPLICFEAVFPALAREVTQAGAEILVNITNDAFLGDSAGPRQHLALASLRAVEDRRWLLRAANTGISAVVDDRGRIRESLPYGTAGEIVVDVPLGEGLSFYARHGEGLGWACVILAFAALLAPRPVPGGTSWTRIFSDDTPP